MGLYLSASAMFRLFWRNSTPNSIFLADFLALLASVLATAFAVCFIKVKCRAPCCLYSYLYRAAFCVFRALGYGSRAVRAYFPRHTAPCPFYNALCKTHQPYYPIYFTERSWLPHSKPTAQYKSRAPTLYARNPLDLIYRYNCYDYQCCYRISKKCQCKCWTV